MARIPIKDVTVLGVKTRVRWNSRKIDPDDWGDYDPERREIRIGRHPLLQQKEALLHEIFHAIERETGFEMNHDHMTLLARHLLTVMRDNPDVERLIFGAD